MFAWAAVLLRYRQTSRELRHYGCPRIAPLAPLIAAHAAGPTCWTSISATLLSCVATMVWEVRMQVSRILIVFILIINQSYAYAEEMNIEQKIKLLADTTMQLCGLGMQITYSGNGNASAVIGIRIPGINAEAHGTKSEIPTLLKDLVPESSQASETRECVKPFLERIFSLIEKDSSQGAYQTIYISPDIQKGQGPDTPIYLGIIDAAGLFIQYGIKSKIGYQYYTFDLEHGGELEITIDRINTAMQLEVFDDATGDSYGDVGGNQRNPVHFLQPLLKGRYRIEIRVAGGRATFYELKIALK